MRRLATAAVLGLGVCLLSPVQHASATERCVTRAEYRKAHDGLTKERLAAIFDSAGKKTWAEGRYEVRNWVPCVNREFGYVSVSFKDGREVSKRAHF